MQFHFFVKVNSLVIKLTGQYTVDLIEVRKGLKIHFNQGAPYDDQNAAQFELVDVDVA